MKPYLCLAPDILDAVEHAVANPFQSVSPEVFPFLPQPSEEQMRAALIEGFNAIDVPVYATVPGRFL